MSCYVATAKRRFSSALNGDMLEAVEVSLAL